MIAYNYMATRNHHLKLYIFFFDLIVGECQDVPDLSAIVKNIILCIDNQWIVLKVIYQAKMPNILWILLLSFYSCWFVKICCFFL